MKKYYIMILLFVLAGCAKVQEWGYGKSDGPEKWGEISDDYLTCEQGQMQSPINIKDSESIISSSKIENINYDVSEFVVENNGHTIEFVDEGGKNTFEFNGKVYKLNQMHFHADSEHQIDSKSYPLELHLVHSNDQGEKLVVAVMFSVGEKNDFIGDNFMKDGEKFVADPGVLLPKDYDDYFTYSGSLTTPPCSEGVDFIVEKTPMWLSEEQLEQFNKYYEGNSRPVQDNKNPVYSSK